MSLRPYLMIYKWEWGLLFIWDLTCLCEQKSPSLSLKSFYCFIICLQIYKITLKYVENPHKWQYYGFEAWNLGIWCQKDKRHVPSWSSSYGECISSIVSPKLIMEMCYWCLQEWHIWGPSKLWNINKRGFPSTWVVAWLWISLRVVLKLRWHHLEDIWSMHIGWVSHPASMGHKPQVHSTRWFYIII